MSQPERENHAERDGPRGRMEKEMESDSQTKGLWDPCVTCESV